MERGRIIALATEVIPPENTPEKTRDDALIAKPRWKYVGPADSIRFEWQIGKWGWAGFAGETERKYITRSQPASMELKEFTTSLPAISLSPLSPGDYACEIWFKDKFSDLRVIVENCVRIVEEAPPAEYTLEVTIEPPGAGYVTISPRKATYSAGEVVTLTAYPYSGYEFDYWGGWPAYPGIGSTSPSIEIAMDADWWVVAVFREAAPVTTVTVRLKNPPSGANRWGLTVYDWSGVKSLGTTVYAVDGEASFDIPSDWALPLRFWISVIYYPDGSVTLLHQAQSLTPDWPNYIEEFIPDYGSYFYNVATRKFEKF